MQNASGCWTHEVIWLHHLSTKGRSIGQDCFIVSRLLSNVCLDHPARKRMQSASGQIVIGRCEERLFGLYLHYISCLRSSKARRKRPRQLFTVCPSRFSNRPGPLWSPRAPGLSSLASMLRDLSTTQTFLLSAIFPVSYVASIYLRSASRLSFSSSQGKPLRGRDDQGVIKARLLAVSLSTLLSVVIVTVLNWTCSRPPARCDLPPCLGGRPLRSNYT